MQHLPYIAFGCGQVSLPFLNPGREAVSLTDALNIVLENFPGFAVSAREPHVELSCKGRTRKQDSVPVRTTLMLSARQR